MAATFNLQPIRPSESKFQIRILQATAQNSFEEERISQAAIDRLQDSRYQLLQSMIVRYERMYDSSYLPLGYMASFDEANFAVPGLTKQDAYDALEAELLDAFDDWTSDEAALGLGPKQQLGILRKYIQRC